MGADVAMKHSPPDQVRQSRNNVRGAGDEYPLAAAAKRKRLLSKCWIFLPSAKSEGQHLICGVRKEGGSEEEEGEIKKINFYHFKP